MRQSLQAANDPQVSCPTSRPITSPKLEKEEEMEQDKAEEWGNAFIISFFYSAPHSISNPRKAVTVGI